MNEDENEDEAEAENENPERNDKQEHYQVRDQTDGEREVVGKKRKKSTRWEEEGGNGNRNQNSGEKRKRDHSWLRTVCMYSTVQYSEEDTYLHNVIICTYSAPQ